jgi:hypothetical protein
MKLLSMYSHAAAIDGIPAIDGVAIQGSCHRCCSFPAACVVMSAVILTSRRKY